MDLKSDGLADTAQAPEKAWFSAAGIGLESGWKQACQFAQLSERAKAAIDRPSRRYE
jgi:hypothetical protein